MTACDPRRPGWLDAGSLHLVRRALAGESRFERRFGGEPQLATFAIERFPFRRHIETLLAHKGIVSVPTPLDELHHVLTPADMEVDASQVNHVTEAFYTTSGHFLRLYRRFVREVLAAGFLAGDLYFQAVPTVRFHFPDAVGMPDRPMVHNDVMLGHPPHEINVWLPLTDAARSRSFVLGGLKPSRELLEAFGYDPWRLLEALGEDGDVRQAARRVCHPVVADYGQAVLFDARCLHAARRNRSTSTRVSIDFRVVPVEDMRALPMVFRGTGRRQAVFLPGGYYHPHPTGTGAG